jgi:hypothetical protein
LQAAGIRTVFDGSPGTRSDLACDPAITNGAVTDPERDPGHTSSIADTDVPGADARTPIRSIRRIRSLPPTAPLRMCHDEKPPARNASDWQPTAAELRAPHGRFCLTPQGDAAT